MTKKLCAVLVLIIFAVGGLAAADFAFSVGTGYYLSGDFGGGFETSSLLTMQKKMKTPYFGGGGFVFIDATYAELSLGFFGGGGKTEISSSGMIGQIVRLDLSIINLNIGLLSKYPFKVGRRISIFPLLGIDYQVTIFAKIDNEVLLLGTALNPIELSALWFKNGIGADFGITDHLFLRSVFLYGLRIPNKFEKDMRDLAEMSGAIADTRLGHGLTIKIALGYKF
ncbi:MAG: hypothetical protein LBC60_12270 [Spirochaetaceae bacterium]|jgi:hypothetical protein|nr:hypothetical protein [Spirochaetaceae bacterium]